MVEIKPCPFCGNKADYWEDNQYSDSHVIECLNCGAHKRSAYGYEDVKTDWNRRFDAKGNEMVDAVTTRFRPRVVAHEEDGGTFIIKESLDTFEDLMEARVAGQEMAAKFSIDTQVIEV